MSSMGQQNSKKSSSACVGDKPQEQETKRESGEVKTKRISSCLSGNSSDSEQQIEQEKVAQKSSFPHFRKKSSESDSPIKGGEEKLSKISDNKLFPSCCDGTDSHCVSRAEHQQNAKKPFLSCFGVNSEDDESQADTGKKSFSFGFRKRTSSYGSNLKEDAKVKYSGNQLADTSLPLRPQARENSNIQSLYSSPHSNITEASIQSNRQYSPFTHSRSKSDSETAALFPQPNFTDIATRQNSDSISVSPSSTPQPSRLNVCSNNDTSNQVERPSFELMSNDGSLRLYSRSTLTLINSSGVRDEERIRAYLNIPFPTKGAPSFASSYDCSSNESDNVFVYDYEESPDLIPRFQSVRVDSDSNVRPRERDSGYAPHSKSSTGSHYYESGDECNHIMAPPPTPNSMCSNSEISPIEISPPENITEGPVIEQQRISPDHGYFQETSGVQDVSNSCDLLRNSEERYPRVCARQDATLSNPDDNYTSVHTETSKGKPVTSNKPHSYSKNQKRASYSNDRKLEFNNTNKRSQVSSMGECSQMAPDLTPSMAVSHKKQPSRICGSNLQVAFRNAPSQVITCDKGILSHFLNSQKMSMTNLQITAGHDYAEVSTEDVFTDNADSQIASGQTYSQMTSQKSHRETHNKMGFENRHRPGISANQQTHLIPEKTYTSGDRHSHIISKKDHIYESDTLPNHLQRKKISTLNPRAESAIAKPKSETVDYDQRAQALNAVNTLKEFSLSYDDPSHLEYRAGYQKKGNHPKYINLPQTRAKPRRKYHRKQRSKSADLSADTTLTYYRFIDGPLADHFEQSTLVTTRLGPIGAEISDSGSSTRRRHASADYAY